MKLTLSELATSVDGIVVGNKDSIITGVSEIQNACAGTITFLDNPIYNKYLSIFMGSSWYAFNTGS